MAGRHQNGHGGDSGARSCLVVGSGRSGTSMLGGVLAGGGFYMGSNPLPVDYRLGANPKGLFEDRETVEINEALLAPMFPRPRTWVGRKLRRPELERGVRWAAALPPDVAISSGPATDARIAAHVARRPFLFKDPRFAYTLPAWRPFIGEALLICIFREPGKTAGSLVREWERHPRRRSRMTYEYGLAHWRSVYTRILDRYRDQGEWLFVHYDQVLDGTGIPRIEDALGVSVDATFPDARLNRTPAGSPAGPRESAIYKELCSLTGVAVRTASC